MTDQALFIFLCVISVINLSGVIAVGRIIKNYGSLVQMVEDHERILHNGLIDSIEEIGRKVAIFEGCPAKIDALSKEFSELKGEIKTYMKMKK